MSDQISGSEAAKAIANPLGTFVAWLAGHLPEGAARTLLYVVTGLCVVILPFIYRYYLGVLPPHAHSFRARFIRLYEAWRCCPSAVIAASTA
jgi:hypothetical protein